jgi:hypothetical protein
MPDDFEVLPIGAHTEVRLGRSLLHSLHAAQTAGLQLPASVEKALTELLDHHAKMLACESGG